MKEAITSRMTVGDRVRIYQKPSSGGYPPILKDGTEGTIREINAANPKLMWVQPDNSECIILYHITELEVVVP